MLKNRGKMGDSSWLNECHASICRDYRPMMCSAGDRQSWKPYICQVTKIHQHHHHPIAEMFLTSNRYNLVSRWPLLRHVLNSGWVYSTCFRKAYCFSRVSSLHSYVSVPDEVTWRRSIIPRRWQSTLHPPATHILPGLPPLNKLCCNNLLAPNIRGCVQQSILITSLPGLARTICNPRVLPSLN